MKTLLLAMVLALAGCASGPVPPDWQMNAHAAFETALSAYLDGNMRLAETEFARGRGEVARTGRLDLLARAELMRCAARVASLEFGVCAGYETVARDAGASERAYAQFLAGRWAGLDAAALPVQYRALVAAQGEAQTLNAIEDPMSHLVASGVVMQMGRMTPAGIVAATEVASGQGWRRPLLAWLGVQAARARAAGDTAELERVQRRMALTGGAALPNP